MQPQRGVEYRDVVVARQQLGAPFLDRQLARWAKGLAQGLSYLHDKCRLIHQVRASAH